MAKLAYWRNRWLLFVRYFFFLVFFLLVSNYGKRLKFTDLYYTSQNVHFRLLNILTFFRKTVFTFAFDLKCLVARENMVKNIICVKLSSIRIQRN